MQSEIKGISWYEIKVLSVFAIFVVIFLNTINFVSATEYINLNEQNSINLKSNDYYTYFEINTLKGVRNFGVNKTDGGIYMFNLNNNLRIIPVLIGRVSGNNWLCPIRNSTDNVIYGNDIYEGKYIIINGNGIEECYRQDSLTTKTNINLNLNELKFQLNDENKFKITVNVSIDNAITIQNKGFGFLIVSNKYKLSSNNIEYDLTSNQNIPVNYNLKLSDNNYNDIFDWGDMQNTTNGIVVANYGNKIGALIYSFGYGSGNKLYIDPSYSVDLSPEPAMYLINGSLRIYNDTQFTTTKNITLNLSDNNDETSILIKEYDFYYSTQNFFEDFDLNPLFGANWTLINSWTKSGIDTYSGSTRKALGSGDAGILQTKFFNVSCPISLSYYSKLSFIENFELFKVEYNIGDGIWYKISEDYGTYSDYKYNRFIISECSNNISIRFTCRTSSTIKSCSLENVEIRSLNPFYGKGISAKFNQKYNSSYNYFLNFKVNDSINGNLISIYGYNENNSINNTIIKLTNLYSPSGWISIPINNILIKENGIINYTHLRFWIDMKDYYVSELRLRLENLEDNFPSVNCLINKTGFLNLSQLTRLNCNLTDDIQIANGSMYYTIETENYKQDYTSLLNVNDNYYYDFNCTENSHITINSVSASDITGQKTTSNLGFNINCHKSPKLNISFPQGNKVEKDVQVIYNFSSFLGYNNNYGNNCEFYVRNSLTYPNYVFVLNKTNPIIGYNLDTLNNMIGGYHNLKMICKDRWINNVESFGSFNVSGTIAGTDLILPIIQNLTIFNSTNCIYDKEPYFNRLPFLSEKIYYN